jgi:beta-lactamase class A
MTQRQVRRVAAGILGSAALAMLLPLASADPAVAAVPACSSAAHPALAAKLSSDISRALRDRTDTVSLSVWDPRTGVRCAVHATRHFDSASAVKATIMAAVLRRAQEQHRGLRSWEKARLHTMITYSDNDSASALWSSLGRSRIDAFLRLAGMSDTEPGPGGFWGLTRWRRSGGPTGWG